MSKYEIGRQPCGQFVPKRDGNGYGEWDNVHQCVFCVDSTVSFCESCCKDHHADGYETCRRIRLEAAVGLEAR